MLIFLSNSQQENENEMKTIPLNKFKVSTIKIFKHTKCNLWMFQNLLHTY